MTVAKNNMESDQLLRKNLTNIALRRNQRNVVQRFAWSVVVFGVAALFAYWKTQCIRDIVLVTSSLSIYCNAIVILCIGYSKLFRKHPSLLLYHKSGIDLVLGALALLMCTNSIELYIPREVLPSMQQGLQITSECWFFSIAYDLYTSITNPFSLFEKDVQYYRKGSCLLGMVICIGYGITFQQQNVRFENVLASYWDEKAMYWFYGWVLAFVVLAMMTLVFVRRKLRDGLKDTFITRKSVFTNGALASVTFVVWSLGVLGLYTYVYYIGKADNFKQYTFPVKALVILRCAHGQFNLLAFLLVNRKVIACALPFFQRGHVAVDIDEGKPQLNIALRKQLSTLVTTGIFQTMEYYIDQRQRIYTNTAFSMHWNAPEGPKEVAIPVNAPVNGGITPESGEDLQFYDFQPQAFGIIRELFAIDHKTYGEAFSSTAIRGKLSDGKSGAFLLYSANEKFLVKSMTKTEQSCLLSLLPAYIQYLKWNAKSTFLPKFLGCHSMRLYGQTFSFVVMTNILTTPHDRDEVTIHRRYDIKGSWVDRNSPICVNGGKYSCSYCQEQFIYGEEAPCPSKQSKFHKPNITLRDNDLKKKLRIPNDYASLLLKQLSRDSTFLAGQGIMDYSLLIGMHYSDFTISTEGQVCRVPTTRQYSTSSESDVISVPMLNTSHINNSNSFIVDAISGPSMYYLGMVDVLQQYTMKKKIERMYKVYVLRKDKKGISVMKPRSYAKRFQNKVSQLLS